MSKLNRITINGFRSIKETTLEIGPLNVMIGANGAGKSNLIAFFKLMNELMGGRLQQHIGATGRAAANLHFGPKKTPQLEAKLEFDVDNGTNAYRMRLFHAAGDSLVFAEEEISFQQTGYTTPKVVPLGAGHEETRIKDKVEEGDVTAKNLTYLLNNCRVYHFHDTSPSARVLQYCYVDNKYWLMPDAANLAPILYDLKSSGQAAYRRIVATVRQVAPFFEDFVLEPDSGADSRDIILNWRHRGSDLVFGPHQLSDGTLRAICLISLLLLPSERLPGLIVVDEPELGLHPYALNLVVSLIRAASRHTQVLVSTQSTAFVDNFEPEDIIVVERNDEEATEFSRPDTGKLNEWLEDYSLGEIWEKNVIGAGPH